MHWIMIIMLGGRSYDDTPAITTVPFSDEKACVAAANKIYKQRQVNAIECVDQTTGEANP